MGVAEVTVFEHVLDGLAVVLVLIAARGLFLLFWPYKTCGWCKDRREHPRPWNRRRCWFCHNTRMRRRLGAGLVHKVKLSLRQAWDEREWWR
jgi:hypothetical protein